MRALLTGRAFRLLGTMLMSGVPLVEGIRLCQHAVKNRLFRDLFVEVERDVLQGAGLARPLLAARFLPPGAAQMVVTAERSGRMGEVLKNIGEYYEDQGEQYFAVSSKWPNGGRRSAGYRRRRHRPVDHHPHARCNHAVVKSLGDNCLCSVRKTCHHRRIGTAIPPLSPKMYRPER